MARRLIDISVPLQNDVPADPPGINPAIQYHDHQQSLPRMLGFFAGLKAEDLPDGKAGRWKRSSSRPITAPISMRPTIIIRP